MRNRRPATPARNTNRLGTMPCLVLRGPLPYTPGGVITTSSLRPQSLAGPCPCRHRLALADRRHREAREYSTGVSRLDFAGSQTPRAGSEPARAQRRIPACKTGGGDFLRPSRAFDRRPDRPFTLRQQDPVPALRGLPERAVMSNSRAPCRGSHIDGGDLGRP